MKETAQYELEGGGGGGDGVEEDSLKSSSWRAIGTDGFDGSAQTKVNLSEVREDKSRSVRLQTIAEA